MSIFGISVTAGLGNDFLGEVSFFLGDAGFGEAGLGDVTAFLGLGDAFGEAGATGDFTLVLFKAFLLGGDTKEEGATSLTISSSPIALGAARGVVTVFLGDDDDSGLCDDEDSSLTFLVVFFNLGETNLLPSLHFRFG